MRRPQAPAPVPVIEYFGGLKPTGVLHADDFRQHDATRGWEDGGQAMALAEQMIQQFCETMRAYGAEQARDAVAEYGSGAYVDMAMIEGRPSIVVDLSNEAAQLRVYWSLEDLLARVAQEAIERGAEDMLNGIYEACSRATLMLQATPVPEPEPPRLAPQPVPVRGKPIAPRAAVPQVRRGVPARG
jgi:hypothetical protein